MSIATLLPPNATVLERALEAVTVRGSEIPVPVGDTWNPATCPAALLPWLAWSLSVDDWEVEWTDERKREVIAASIAIHRRKGTVWAIRRALQVAGLGDATLIERYGVKFHDAAHHYDGTITYDLPDHWAEYRVILSRPISIAQAQKARAILATAAPARCHLKALDFTQAQNLYDAAISYDGSYSHGVS